MTNQVIEKKYETKTQKTNQYLLLIGDVETWKL